MNEDVSLCLLWFSSAILVVPGFTFKTYSEELDLEPVSLLSLRVIKYTDNWHVRSPKHM